MRRFLLASVAMLPLCAAANATTTVSGPQTYGSGISVGTDGTVTFSGLYERSAGQAASDASGLWPSSASAAFVAVSELAASGTDPVGAVSHLAPRWTMLIDTKTTTSILDSVSLGIVNLSYNTGAKIYGINTVIGGNAGGQAPAEVTGWECDMQGVINATTISQCVEFQAFNGITVSVGGRFTGNGTGSFNIGWDYSGATFNTTAIKLGNAQTMSFYDTGGTLPAKLSMDASNNFAVYNLAGLKTVFGKGDGSKFSLTLNNADVNYLQVNPSAAGNAPSLQSIGADTNIALTLASKGSGVVQLNSNGSNALTAGPGVQVGAPTGGDKGAGTANFAGAIYANGTVGVSCTIVGATAHLTVVNGIVTLCN